MSDINRKIEKRAELLEAYSHAGGNPISNQAAWQKADTEMEASFNLYRSQNVSGYTGTPGNNPTVYYQNRSHHGRVTQDHDYKTNIGKSFPSSNQGYTFQNEMVEQDNGTMQAAMVERQGGDVVHTSRNPFNAVTSQQAKRALHGQTQGSPHKPKDSSIDGHNQFVREYHGN